MTRLDDGAVIVVEVVYAEPARQRTGEVQVMPGATIADVLSAAQQLPVFADLALQEHVVGVYGQVVDDVLEVRHGDRVEIYRPLQVDAKTARRLRAAKQVGGHS